MAVESGAASPDSGPARRLVAARDTVWRLVVSTVGTCFRNRVTGLAAEAAFFALLSLPPLIFGLAGSIGYVFAGFSRQPGRARSATSILELCVAGAHPADGRQRSSSRR